MDSNVAEIFFNGRKEILEILNTGGDIVRHLLRLNPVCPLIGADIKLEDQLGKGAFGTVFLIDFPGKGSKLYAAKRNDIKTFNVHFPEDQTYAERLREIISTKRMYGLEDFNINAADFFSFNGIENPDSRPNEDVYLYYPKFMANACTTKKKFERTDGMGEITVPKGSLVCQNTITEIILSLMAGELARESSINFIDTFYFATCHPKPDEVQQYTFMEKIDTSFDKLIGDSREKPPILPVYGREPSDEEIISVYLQTVHALLVLQNNFAIVHGDLHLDNLFIEKSDKATWKGEALSQSEFLEFEINGKPSLYIPTKDTKYIAKIGDWGLSVKYPTSENNIIIGDEMVFENGYNQYDTKGPWLPNFYSKAYDVAFFTARIHTRLPKNVFIRSVIMWMLGYSPDQVPNADTKKTFKETFMFGTGWRPNIKNKALTTTLSHVSPLTILTNRDLMGKYLDVPSGKILKVSSDGNTQRRENPKIAGSIRESPGSLKTSEITPKMRNITVEWMVQIADDAQISEEKFILAVAILDFYLNLVAIKKSELQTVACVAMQLAFSSKKLNEEYFMNMSEGSCSLDKQSKVKGDMTWKFVESGKSFQDLPNTMKVLEDYKEKGLVPFGTRYNYAKYALYVAAAEAEMLKYSAEQIAACAVILSRASSLIKDLDPLKNIESVTKLRLTELKYCLLDLAEACRKTTSKQINTIIYQKFISGVYKNVSQNPIQNLADIVARM